MEIVDHSNSSLLLLFSKHYDLFLSLRFRPLILDDGYKINNNNSTIRPSDSQQEKRTCRIVDLVIPADHRVKLKVSEKRDKYQDLARELKAMEYEGDGDTYCYWCTGNNPQRISKRSRRLGNQRASGDDHPDNNIIKIRLNTKKSP